MIQSENKISKSLFTHPWSLTLAVSIITFSLWRVKMSALRNNRDNSYVDTKLL